MLGILIEVGAVEAAAVLHGSIAAVGVSHALPFVPADAEQLSEDLAELRSVLGPAAFADAARRGAALKDGEIVSFVKGQTALLTNDPASVNSAGVGED